MGRTAVFNGVELVIPDAYSALDVSRLLTPTSGGVGIVALVGEADGGKPGVNIFPGGTSPAVVKKSLRSGPLADACRLALRSGTDPLVQAGASTIVAMKTNNSTPSILGVGGVTNGAQEKYDADFGVLTGASFDVVGTGLSFKLAGGVDQIWFKVTDGTNTQTAPVGAGITQHEVDILTADTASQIAAKAQAIIAGISGLSATVASAIIHVTHTALAALSDAADVDASVTITVTQQGVDPDPGAFTLTTKQYGVFTALYTAEIATIGVQKFVTVRDDQGVPETSPALGVTSYLNLKYTGNGSAAAMQLKWVSGFLRLQVTLTGESDGSADIDLDVTTLTVGNIAQIVAGLTGYEATVDPSRQQFLASDLDLYLTDQDIKTPVSGFDFKASIKELINWGTSQSQLVSVTRGSMNQADTVPGTLAPTQFAGGTRGTTSNSNFQDDLNTLLALRINIMVPLVSSDNQDGSTMLVSTINAQVKDHVQNRSGILGRSECQAYVSIQGNKDAFKTECGVLNSRWVACTSQKITDLDIAGNQKVFDEWAFAVVCAQTQAGSPIGTDLTYRALPILGITQDVSWNPVEDGPELIKAGALIAGPDDSNVNRIIAGYTTWLADDNNANIYIETVESLAIFAFNHRKYMKQRFLGQSAFTRDDILKGIEASVDVETNTTKSIKGFDLKQVTIISASAGRLEYEVPVIPFEGIKFVLPTVVAIRETA
jgi:hypothetical protein